MLISEQSDECPYEGRPVALWNSKGTQAHKAPMARPKLTYLAALSKNILKDQEYQLSGLSAFYTSQKHMRRAGAVPSVHCATRQIKQASTT